MAVPSYDELLARYDLDRSTMEQTFDEDHLREFSSVLDKWERLARSLGLTNPNVENIKSQGDLEEQRDGMLECWRQRCGSAATYEAMAKALLRINRTDLAEKVVTLGWSSRGTPTSAVTMDGSCLTTSISPANSCSSEDVSSPASLSLLASPSNHMAQDIIPTLRELEEEFFGLVTCVENTLEVNKVKLTTITKRFRMLPQSVRRQHETDKNYRETRQKILDSETTKELFDNLTALRHWSFMMPDTLEYILQDVKVDDIHRKINKYKDKLSTFKANTKLSELIGINFPVPDYCIELTMEVKGWQDKTIKEVEMTITNVMRRGTYNGHVAGLGWKRVITGSIKLTFILMESISLSSERLCDICIETGVISLHIDGDNAYSKESKVAINSGKAPCHLWYSSDVIHYSIRGRRNVLIIFSDLLLPHPKAVARRPGHLTQEDKQKLSNQGVPPDCQDELAIVNMRYKIDKRHTIFEVKSGQHLSRKEIIDSIMNLLTMMQNDGAVIYYIGAGKRNTGDWCFRDGFITFRDIAELYLKTRSEFRGHVLTIISDCSYSGCWVRDCMEFLDEQGVQPCGHKAREKGMVFKVYASCKQNEIPTEYHFSVSGAFNDKKTKEMGFWLSKQLSETQMTSTVDSSKLLCNNLTIDEPCTLPPGYTWKELASLL